LAVDRAHRADEGNSMPSLQTSKERIDTVLTLARTRAGAHADEGNAERAYRALLRGVQSAQRANSRGQTGTVLHGLWAMPAVKAVMLGSAGAVIAALTWSKGKSRSASVSETSASDAPDSAADSAIPQQRKRFRRRSRTGGDVAVEDATRVDV
jgi:hypothetical protein